MLIPRVIFFLLTVLATCAPGWCSGLPYVRANSGLDAKQTRYGVIVSCEYKINGQNLPDFKKTADHALERSLSGAITETGGSAKILVHEDYDLLMRTISSKARGVSFSPAWIRLVHADSETEIGDYKELFKKNAIDVLLMVKGPVFITPPAIMYQVDAEGAALAFYRTAADIKGSHDSEHLQFLAVLPDGKFAFASDLQEFGVSGWGAANKKARLIDEDLRNEMMAAVYKNYLDALSVEK